MNDQHEESVCLSKLDSSHGLNTFSCQLIKRITKGAFSEIEVKNSICLLCNDILKQASALAGVYSYYANVLFSRAMEEGLVKFTEHYNLMHKIIPWADQSVKAAISEVSSILDFSQNLADSVMFGVRAELKRRTHLKLLGNTVAIICDNFMREALLEYSRLPKFEMTVVDYDMPSQEALNAWADVFTDKIMEGVSPSTERFKAVNLAQKSDRHTHKFADYNLSNNNNCVIEDLYYDELPQNKYSHDLYDTYAEEVMMDICSLQNLKDSFVHPESGVQHKPVRYESCETISIGSDLSSPHSSIDSRGLYHFADKLLYSLSILENHSNDFTCDIIESHSSLLKDYRRSSAPALLTGPRRASLQTVFESDIYEDPGSVLKTEAKVGYPMPRLFQRRHHSIQESEGFTLQSAKKFEQEKYGDAMAKNILCCAFKDIF